MSHVYYNLKSQLKRQNLMKVEHYFLRLKDFRLNLLYNSRSSYSKSLGPIHILNL